MKKTITLLIMFSLLIGILMVPQRVSADDVGNEPQVEETIHQDENDEVIPNEEEVTTEEFVDYEEQPLPQEVVDREGFLEVQEDIQPFEDPVLQDPENNKTLIINGYVEEMWRDSLKYFLNQDPAPLVGAEFEVVDGMMNPVGRVVTDENGKGYIEVPKDRIYYVLQKTAPDHVYYEPYAMNEVFETENEYVCNVSDYVKRGDITGKSLWDPNMEYMDEYNHNAKLQLVVVKEMDDGMSQWTQRTYVPRTTRYNLTVGEEQTITWSNMPLYYNDGTMIEYGIFDVAYQYSDWRDTLGWTYEKFRNIYTDYLTVYHTNRFITFDVTKTWGDDEQHDPVVFHLMRYGVDTGKIIEVSEDTNWRGTVRFIADMEHAVEYYSLKEDVPEGYTSFQEPYDNMNNRDDANWPDLTYYYYFENRKTKTDEEEKVDADQAMDLINGGYDHTFTKRWHIKPIVNSVDVTLDYFTKIDTRFFKYAETNFDLFVDILTLQTSFIYQLSPEDRVAFIQREFGSSYLPDDDPFKSMESFQNNVRKAFENHPSYAEYVEKVLSIWDFNSTEQKYIPGLEVKMDPIGRAGDILYTFTLDKEHDWETVISNFLFENPYAYGNIYYYDESDTGNTEAGSIEKSGEYSYLIHNYPNALIVDYEVDGEIVYKTERQSLLDATTQFNYATFKKVWEDEPDDVQEIRLKVSWKMNFESQASALIQNLGLKYVDTPLVVEIASYYYPIAPNERTILVDYLNEAIAERYPEANISRLLGYMWDDLAPILRGVFSDDENYYKEPSNVIHVDEDGTCWFEVVLKKENDWYAEVDGINLPAYGTIIEELTNIPGQEMEYENDVNHEFVVTNKVMRTFDVEKVWEDQDNVNQLRPNSIDVALMKDGETIETGTLTEENGWKYTFQEVPKYSGEGDNKQEINYTVSEVVVPDEYKSEVVRNGDHFIVTNTYEPEIPVGTEEQELLISKVDLNGVELPGAKIEIQTQEGEIIDSWTSTKEPHMMSLSEGTYVFHEDTAPVGYQVVTDIEFNVNAEGEVEVTKIDGVVEAQGNKLVVTDKPIEVPDTKVSNDCVSYFSLFLVTSFLGLLLTIPKKRRWE